MTDPKKATNDKAPPAAPDVPTIIADFEGVPTDAIYPVRYTKGMTCPPELVDAAIAAGALEYTAPRAAPANKAHAKAPETK